MVDVIVEHTFDEPVSDEAHDRFAERVGLCLVAHDIAWQRSYLSADRTRMVCHFEALDAETVREAHRMAGIKTARVWTAELYARK